jgi:hypothetical protein
MGLLVINSEFIGLAKVIVRSWSLSYSNTEVFLTV